MSEPMNVYSAINAVQAELATTGITKERMNQQQGFKFRGIDDIYNAVSPLMAKHKLCVLPRMLSRKCEERLTKTGNPLFYVVVEAEFDFVSTTDGSKHVARTFGEAMDSADKATNKAMSAAYKYVVMQAFAIPTEGDNDADAATPEVMPKGAGFPQRGATPGQNMQRMVDGAADLQAMKNAMLADIASDKFTTNKSVLHADIKAHIQKLTKPDQDDVWKAWEVRRDALIDADKSAKLAATLTQPLTFADKLSEVDDVFRMLEDNKAKLTMADYRAAKSRIENARGSIGKPAGNVANPLTAKMPDDDIN